MLRTAPLVYVLFNVPHATNPNLTTINPGNFEVATNKYLVISKVDSSEANMATFDCGIFQQEIHCAMASNGVFVRRVILSEQPEGLVVKNRAQLFQIYDDTYPLKISINSRFIAVLSMSPRNGIMRVLIYNSHLTLGSQYVWAGLNIGDYSKKPPCDLEILLTSQSTLLINVNDRVGTMTKPAYLKSFQLQNATLVVRNPQYSEIGKYKLILNGGASGYPRSFIHAPNLFLTLEEQKGVQKTDAVRWYHWVIAIVIFAIIFTSIYTQMRKEYKIRQELRERVLLENVGHEIKL